MAKFQVEVPEGFDQEETEAEERPGFSFRGEEPVGVGEDRGNGAPEETPRQKSLGTVLAILLGSHDQLQNADTQLFTLANFIAGLKTGESSIENNHGKVKEMVDVIRKNLISSIVTLDQTLLVIDLEERGVLGQHDGREFARLGLQLLDKIRTEYDRWNIAAEPPAIPAEAIELMKQAVAQMEAEQEAANA